MKFIKLYANFLKKFLKPKRPLKVVFDCSNGTAGLVIGKLSNLVNRGLEFILINDEPDGNFPAHGPNPMLSNALNQLKRAVIKHKADLGVIFDGDGDRVFFTDNRGRFVNPDIVAALISQNYKGPIILDLRSGYLSRELISADKKRIIDSRVGHYFIKKLMREKKSPFAAELSGHYYFRDFFGADSGIFAAIQFINAVSGLKTGLVEFIDSLPKYYQSGELNFRVKDKEGLMKKAENIFKKDAKEISRLDGLKMEFPAWWFNLRPSNTENLLRLNMEARKKITFEQKLKELNSLY